MYKTVVGNEKYLISPSGDIRELNGNLVKVNNGKINIDIFNKHYIVDSVWLGLAAHYELSNVLIRNNNINNIIFLKINPTIIKSAVGDLPIFKVPIYFKKGFRFIPQFSRYAISRDGVIIDTSTNDVVRISYSGEYPKVNIYNPDKNEYTQASVHRLVASAWVYNESYISKPIVNHIDGNKQNYHFKNLEWCDYKHNNNHAVISGLRNDNNIFKMKDIITKEIVIIHSFRKVCEFLNLPPDTKYNTIFRKRKNRLINDRYEIKQHNDNTPWLMDTGDYLKRGMYRIIVTMPNGEVRTYNDTRDMTKDLKIWNTSSLNSKIARAEKDYPGIKIDVKQNYYILPIQALNVKTNKIIEADSIRSMSRILNINYAYIHRRVISNSNLVYKDYIFRYKSNEPFTEPSLLNKNLGIRISLLNIVNCSELKFNSLRAASKFLNSDRSAIKTAIKYNTPLNGYNVYYS